MVASNGIRVNSFVHTENGLADVDELGPEEKARAATEIKRIWLNELFRGKAVFEADPSQALRASSPQGASQGCEK